MGTPGPDSALLAGRLIEGGEELEVLALVAAGLCPAAEARRLGIVPRIG